MPDAAPMQQTDVDAKPLAWWGRRLLDIARREGYRSLWFRAWAMAGYHRAAFLVCPLGREDEAAVPAASVTLSTLTDADADEYVAFRRGARVQDFRDRLRHGFVCHAARCDGRLASVTWTATRYAILWLLDAEFDVPPSQIYLFDSFTHDDFRGQRIQGVVFERVRQTALAEGRTRAVTFVVPENEANMRSRSRSGFIVRGTAGRVGVGRACRYFATGEAPKLRRRRR